MANEIIFQDRAGNLQEAPSGSEFSLGTTLMPGDNVRLGDVLPHFYSLTEFNLNEDAVRSLSGRTLTIRSTVVVIDGQFQVVAHHVDGHEGLVPAGALVDHRPTSEFEAIAIVDDGYLWLVPQPVAELQTPIIISSAGRFMLYVRNNEMTEGGNFDAMKAAIERSPESAVYRVATNPDGDYEITASTWGFSISDEEILAAHRAVATHRRAELAKHLGDGSFYGSLRFFHGFNAAPLVRNNGVLQARHSVAVTLSEAARDALIAARRKAPVAHHGDKHNLATGHGYDNDPELKAIAQSMIYSPASSLVGDFEYQIGADDGVIITSARNLRRIPSEILLGVIKAETDNGIQKLRRKGIRSSMSADELYAITRGGNHEPAEISKMGAP